MSDRKPDMSEMTASEVAMRKFLKQLGVTTHQQLEQLLQARVQDGLASAGDKLPVKATIQIEAIGFSHEIEADLILPEADPS